MGKLYRKSFLKENDLLFNKDLIRLQDNTFNMYAVYYARNIVYIDEPLYFYNIERLKSISYKYNSEVEQLYNLILNERLKCFLAFNLLEDVDIKNAFCLDATSVTINVMQRKIFNPENKSNYFGKVKQLKNFLEGGLFSEIFKQVEIR